MKKFHILSLSAAVAFSSLSAADISVSSYGRLSAIGALDFNTGGKDTFVGAVANAGADFSLTNGFKWGLGAIGAWAAYNELGKGSTAPYASSGDASLAYIGYKNKLISFYAGRFGNSFTKFDYLQGNVQGLSIAFSTYEDKMRYWFTYANSYMYNGKQYNAIQGGRIGSDLTSLSAYNPASKNIIGGEMLAAGVDFSVGKKHVFLLKPFVFVNTKHENTALIQGGIKAGTSFALNKDFRSTTILRGTFQYWDKAGISAPIQVLWWADQTFVYSGKDFSADLGGGVLGIAASNGSYIFALSDSSRFYGRMFGQSMSIVSPNYFNASNTLTGYVFGGIKYKGLRVDALASFGGYDEYSIMARYPVWKKDNMRLNVGGGYIYATGIGTTKNNALSLHVQFAY